MLSIMQLRAVGMACLFSVSVKVGFLAESALQFELMEKGVKKEQMLLLGLPLLAIEVWLCVWLCVLPGTLGTLGTCVRPCQVCFSQ
jgi:hypothetical protein